MHFSCWIQIWHWENSLCFGYPFVLFCIVITPFPLAYKQSEYIYIMKYEGEKYALLIITIKDLFPQMID